MQETKTKAIDRRGFLRGVGGASTLAVAAAATAMIGSEAEAYDPGEAETQARYQPDSPNVQAFYRTNGYETLDK